MVAKKYTSDRKRSRLVTKRKKTDVFKKNKLVTGIVLIIIVAVAIAGVYIVYTSNNENGKESGDQNNGSNGQGNEEGNPIAVFDTSMGTIKIELYEDKVPITAKNFIDHANDGYYNVGIFHRVINSFMIQGGDPLGTGFGGHAARYHEGYGTQDNPESWVIPDEFHEDLSNVRGTISMANHGPNTGGSQFFINVVDNTNLDYNKEPLTSKHAVFGKVTEGLDVIIAISELDPDNTDSNNKPYTDVVINSIVIEN